MMLFLQLFITFFFIGLLNFGGGGAMISLIQAQVVTSRGWLTDSVFTDIVAISQMTPGPIGINCATYTGYQVIADAGYGSFAGILGSALATFAVVLPSFIIFFCLVRFFNRFHSHPVFVDTMSVMKPAVAGFIAAAALVLSFHFGWDGLLPRVTPIVENFPDWKAGMLAALAFAASYFFRANPILLILAGGIAGLLLY